MNKNKAIKLAIFSPNILPIPAVDGGAVEELITYIVKENEKHHNYDIDLYTVDNANKLSKCNYKYTNLIRMRYVPDVKRKKFIKFYNKFLIRLPNGRVKSDFSQMITSKFKKNYYDAVLVEDNREVFNSLVSKVRKERLYFHIHDDIYIYGNKLNAVQKLLHPDQSHMIKGIIKSSTKIITASHYLENRFQKLGALNTENLYNAAIKKDLNCLSPLLRNKIRSKYKIPKNTVVFAFIGRFANDKGLDRLLKSLKLLDENLNFKCLIVGKNWLNSTSENNYSDQLSQIYDSMSDKLKQKIIFTGYIDHLNISNIYSISDCVVVPSRNEAFGIVALEAMIMGIPVLASSVGGLPEVIGRSSILVKNDKYFVTRLSKAMGKIYYDSNLRKEISSLEIRQSQKFPTTEEQYFENFCRIVK